MALVTIDEALIYLQLETPTPQEFLLLEALINQVSAIIVTLTELSEEELLNDFRRHLIPVKFVALMLIVREFRRIQDQRFNIKSETLKDASVTYLSDDDIPPGLLRMLQPQGSWVA